MPLTMFAPLFVLRPTGYPLTWLAFAVGSAFTLALSGVMRRKKARRSGPF